MTRTFVELPSFRHEWLSMGLTDEDLKQLQIELLANPTVGAAMVGTGGVRKMRFAFSTEARAAASGLFILTLHSRKSYTF